MKKFTYFTSEFVSPGHPDKVSDQISDAVLDACLKDDPNSRVACEVFCTTGAVRETEELMPLALVLSREILVKLTNMMKNNEIKWARPDQKSQVTLAYDENGKVDHVDSIVVSVQHDEDVSHDEIEKTVIEKVVKPVLEKYNLSSENIKYYINPTGRFVIGGPHGDTGLTGRKIIVDTYGGYFRHGGGAFSGKDPSKVDRSAAYAARWVAKNIVAAELADKCEIQLSYAIGVPKPVSIKVDTFGTSKVDEDKISEAVSKVFDLSPRGIEKALELREGKFKYQDLAAFGHIGRTDIDTPWERLNKVDELKKSIN